MSLPLKAFPHGRPASPARTPVRALATVLVTLSALVLTLVPATAPASAASTVSTQAKKQTHHHKPKHKPKPPPKPVGTPPGSYVPTATSYFSYPNTNRSDSLAIRNRVLRTINSTWGGGRTSIGTPLAGNGAIRMTTWSFDDWEIARALVAARKRGVSVQIVAAKGRNKTHPAWRWLRKRLGTQLWRRGHPLTAETVSFARACKGACRGSGGVAHAKYFLFKNVGPHHAPAVVFQTSMNLTYMAWQGQWNQAQVFHSTPMYEDFLAVFRQARWGRAVAQPFHVARFRSVANYFFPRPHATALEDPVVQILDQTRCTGTTINGGRTKIRINQYAIYGDRAEWISRRLRALWKAGCDIAIIYSVASRPVLSILRNRSGRGPIPMRQSVITDPWGTIVKYNHSKWMTIAGAWGKSRTSYQTFSGSANWSDIAFNDDEQMQRIDSLRETSRHNDNFRKTWRQKSSKQPSFGRVAVFGRGAARAMTVDSFVREAPEGDPPFGTGIYRHLPSD
jgi:phosphatidylserine/phosphatidylglycerophosphate/cardiolipin synthase-like enzyme